jgi:hypothetical protein
LEDRRIAVLSAVAVPTAAGSTSAAAQQYPFCLQGKDWGYPGLCCFWSWHQYTASASGTFSHFGINPRYAFAGQRRSYWRPYRPKEASARLHPYGGQSSFAQRAAAMSKVDARRAATNSAVKFLWWYFIILRAGRILGRGSNRQAAYDLHR